MKRAWTSSTLGTQERVGLRAKRLTPAAATPQRKGGSDRYSVLLLCIYLLVRLFFAFFGRCR